MSRHHNRHHVIIPMNNCDNQYLTKNCYHFTTLRFDESLVVGKITRSEVEDMLNKIHDEVDHFKS